MLAHQRNHKVAPEVVPPSGVEAAGAMEGSSKPKTIPNRSARTPRSPAMVIMEGQQVEVQDQSSGEWVLATVAVILANGDMDIRYHDGTVKKAVNLNHVRTCSTQSPSRSAPQQAAPPASRGATPPRAEADAASTPARPATLPTKGPPTPASARTSSAPQPTAKEQPSVVEASGLLKVGDKVEANYKGRGRWFRGTISRVQADGVYDVDYDDGEKELGLKSDLIKLTGGVGSKIEASVNPEDNGAGSSASEGLLAVGTKVEVNYRGAGRWYPGRVSSIQPSGTYDIAYDDGDTEQCVEKSRVRQVETSSPPQVEARSPTSAGEIKEGSVVDVDLDIASSLRLVLTGKVVAIDHSASTCDVAFNNGLRKDKVPLTSVKEAIRANGLDDSCVAGDSVERKIGQHWLRGRIVQRSSSSKQAYDVEYSGLEAMVPAYELRRLVLPDRAANDRILVRFNNGHVTRYLPAVIQRVKPQGFYDVRYDNGEIEGDVPGSIIYELMPSLAACNQQPLCEGHKVEARFRGGKTWFKGSISRVNADGTYDVGYEDGDKESGVERQLIRSLEVPAAVRVDGELKVGDKVEARYKGKSQWYQGKVSAVNGDGTFDVAYEDGDRDAGLRREFIRSLEQPTKTEKAEVAGATAASTVPFDGTLKEGDEVEARFRGKAKWFKGKITRVNDDGTFDVEYDDGDEECSIVPDHVRHRDVAAAKPTTAAGPSFKEGDKVEVRFRGRAKWFTGRIIKAHLDGTYDVRYDDGDQENKVSRDLIRAIDRQGSETERPTAAERADVGGQQQREQSQPEPQQRRPDSFAVGDRLEGRLHSNDGWVRGQIISLDGHGNFDIRYENREWKYHVTVSEVRAVHPPSTHDKVDAFVTSTGKYEHGLVLSINADEGSYRIQFVSEGGKVEEAVVADADVRAVYDKTGEPVKIHHEHEEGDKVEARYRAGRKWFSAVITATNDDATYDIRYSDGEPEERVKGEHLRLPGGVDRRSSIQDGAPHDCEAEHGHVYAVDDRVEALFRGQSKWLPGRVVGVQHHGTYDILFENGELESDVPTEKIRPLPGTIHDNGLGQSNGGHEVFKLGDAVEALLQGGTVWLKGNVIGTQHHGTYDLLYADGQKESDVPAEHIRRLAGYIADTAAPSPQQQRRPSQAYRRHSQPQQGRRTSYTAQQGGSPSRRPSTRGAGSRPPPARYQAGDRVQGRYKGSKLWTEGKVVGINHEEGGYVTYEIRYETGEREDQVDPVLLRAIPGDEVAHSDASSSALWDEGVFRVGQSVEARLQGGSEWLQGVVTKVAEDGTYEIQYKTGLKESGVEDYLVRESLGVGAKVEAHFRGGKKWFPASVRAVNEDGTFDILFDDGDEEAGVKAMDVRRPGDDSQPSSPQLETFASGDKVEVRYQGLSDWIPGIVSSRNADGTYSVDFENIIAEAAVRPEHIRRAEEGGGDAAAKQEGAEAAPVADYLVSQQLSQQLVSTGVKEPIAPGQKVEGRFRGGKKWFGGTVIMANEDGTYDVRYLDGDVEKGVERSFLRFAEPDDVPVKTVSLTRGMSTYELGENIEARFPFALDYLPGKIIALNRDGTYDVRFEDGSKDSHVHPKYIKKRKVVPKVPAPLQRSEPRYQVAQAVEARLPGTTDWRPALVTAVLENGFSYAVKYQDGGPSSATAIVLAHTLLRLSFRGEEQRSQSFDVGDTVEALYAYGDTFYLAKVVAVREQGALYDLRFTDGDLEAGVPVEYLRPIPPPEPEEPEFDINDWLAIRAGHEWVPARVRRVNQTHEGKFCYDVVTLPGRRRMSRIPVEDLRRLEDAEEAAAAAVAVAAEDSTLGK